MLQYLPEGFELCPQTDLVVEPPSSEEMDWALIDVTTRDRVTLPKPHGVWYLEWLDGYAAVVESLGDRSLPVEDLSRKVIAREIATGELFVLALTPKQRLQKIPLDSFYTDFKDLNVTMPLGPTQTNESFHTCVLRAARAAGSKIYWKITDMYHVLTLTSYKGCPSKWCWRSKKKRG